MILVISAPISATEHTRNHRYRIAAYWWDPKLEIGSGLIIIDRFSLPESEDAEPRSIKLRDTPYTVTVAVMYIHKSYKSGGRPIQVNMVIDVGTNPPHRIFLSPDSAEADMPYHSIMPVGSVSKRIQIDGRLWTVAFVCDDAS
jgi:hypothetical protein